MPENHRARAEWLADKAHHFTYGDGADTATGQALATEALARAVLALTPAAPGVDYDQHNAVVAELGALRRVVAALLHDANTSPDSEAHAVLERFRAELPDTDHGEAVLLLADDLMRTECADFEGGTTHA